jgi:dihydroneopterin aldolase
MHEIDILSQHVSVSDIRVEAYIGVHAHERLHRQLLSISVRLSLVPPETDDLGGTIDYNRIVDECRSLADVGISLIEIFVRRLAEALIAYPGVLRAEVSVEKRGALANGMAGAAIVMVRQPCRATLLRAEDAPLPMRQPA